MVLSVIFSKLAYFYIKSKSKILLGLQYKIITTTKKRSLVTIALYEENLLKCN